MDLVLVFVCGKWLVLWLRWLVSLLDWLLSGLLLVLLVVLACMHVVEDLGDLNGACPSGIRRIPVGSGLIAR